MMQNEAALLRTKTALAQKQEELIKLINDNRMEIQTRYGEQLKRARRELGDFFENRMYEVTDKVNDLLRNKERQYTEIVTAVIIANIKQAVEDEQKKHELLLESLNSSVKDRDERISKLNGRLETLGDILGRAASLRTDLEALNVS